MDKKALELLGLKVFKAVVTEAESTFGLPSALLNDLALNEDNDWQLVIKASVIAEVVLGEAILSSVPSRERSQYTLETNKGLGAKMHCARRLGLIDEAQFQFLRELARIRNVCVHDKAGLSFTFRSYLVSPSQRASFSRKIRPFEYFDRPEMENAVVNGTLPDPQPGTSFLPGGSIVGSLLGLCATLLRSSPTKTH